jgi:MFS transporter
MARTPATPTTTANATATATALGHGHRHHTDGANGVTPAHRGHARPGAGRLLLLVCVAQLMVILDITAVNVALAQLADGLHINSSDIGWTITSYSLIFGSLLLLGGRAADLIGRKRMFLTGLGIFTAASAPRQWPPARQRYRCPRRPRARRGDALARRPLDHHDHLHRRP